MQRAENNLCKIQPTFDTYPDVFCVLEDKAISCARRKMKKREAGVLTGSVFLVVVDSLLLITHGIVLPSRGALADTLNLTISLTRCGPAFAITLLSSSLTPVMALFLSTTEFLRTLSPWLGLFGFLITAITALRRWCSASRAQSPLVIV